MKSNNIISKNSYLISDKLHYLLVLDYFDNYQYEKMSKKKEKESDGVYIVVFRSLCHQEKTLVYNYIRYHDVLAQTLFPYLYARNMFSTLTCEELGNYLICFDNKFMSETAILDLNNDILKEINKFNYSQYKFYDIYNMILKLSYIGDYKNMSYVVDSCFDKNINKFITSVLKFKLNDKEIGSILDNYSDTTYHKTGLIYNCMFVVRNLENFIYEIRERGYNVNEGPQKWRGENNSMNFFLNSIDFDYRTSLYNHNKYHIENNNIDPRLVIPKSKFSYKNIHMRIGSVRWYSTQTRNFSVENRQKFILDNYDDILNLINTNKHMDKIKLQRKIELFCYNQELKLSNSSFLKKKINYSDSSFNILSQKKEEILSVLSNPNTPSTMKSDLVKADTIIWVRKITNVVGVETISNVLLEYFFQLLTNTTMVIDDNHTPGISSLIAFEKIGSKIIERYVYILYCEFNKDNETNLTLSEYKHKHSDFLKELYEYNFSTLFGAYFVWCLVSVGLVYQDVDYSVSNDSEKALYIRVEPEINKLLILENHRIFHLPPRLPMICEPKEYVYSNDPKINKLGGYLLNDEYYTKDLFIDKRGYTNKTTLNEENIVVSLVNGISKTPYKINTETLEFLYKYGISKGILIDVDDKLNKFISTNNYKGLHKKTKKQLLSSYSKLVMEKNILNIAETYGGVDRIYFPIRLDQRTRLYCITDYFDYQKNDLAKGLILFSNPGTIRKDNHQAIKYLMAYGANMYGNGLDKKSINYRIKWIDSNESKILDIENNSLVDNAENKCCFVSFCFEYKRFKKFINDNDSVTFFTYLPIQLDASCNGYQHLALLTNESKLFDKLNLHKSSHDDAPDDFYSYVVEITNKYIKAKLDMLSSLDKLSSKESEKLENLKILDMVSFPRSIVKKTIMTKSYNSKIPRQVDNIICLLDEHCENGKKYYTYAGNSTKLTRDIVLTFIMCMKEVIEIESPRIKALGQYIDEIAKICSKLNTPIPWVLPNGAEILLSYEIERKLRLKPFSFVKSRYSFNKYVEGSLNLRKQKDAAMPNLIHSLDATTIALLYKDFSEYGSLYTVHDCFAVTANNVPLLISILKSVYLKIYSDDTYMQQFDQFVKISLNKLFGDDVYNANGQYVTIIGKRKNKSVLFPDINNVLKFNISNSLEMRDLKLSSNIVT